MKFIKNIIKKSKYNTKALLVVALVVAGAGFGMGAVQAEFYPDRTPFDYSVPCDPSDDNIYDRCGSLTGPVFNSFINTPSYGDERAFADARRSDQTESGSYKNVLPDVNKGSQEVVIRTYVHNNANESTNESGLGVAKGTNVRIDLPEATSNVLRARSYISADNADLVEDTVDLTGTQDFSIEYVPGSAKLYNNTAFSGEGNHATLSDDIVTTGALIGDDAMDGELPGCFEYEATVFITVKIIPEEPDIDFKKEVRSHVSAEAIENGAEKDTWGELESVNPGDRVQWLMTTQNTGEVQLDDINVRDVLPPHVELVPGTVRRVDASRDQILQDGPLFDGGYNVGSYGAGSGVYVMFDTVSLGDFEGCEVRVRNRGFVSSKQTEERSDTADLIIKKTDCVPEKPEEPVFECTDLGLTRVKGRTYRFTTSATAANGATIKHYEYSFGDDSDVLVTDKNTVEHTYVEPGTYIATVDVAFNVDGETKIDADNENCIVKVSFEVKPTATPPTEIPDTGAGSFAGIMAVVAAAGGYFHRVLTLRRQ